MAILVGENRVFHVEAQVEEQHREALEMTHVQTRPAPLVHSDELRRAREEEGFEVETVEVEEDESSLVIASTFQNSSTELKQS